MVTTLGVDRYQSHSSRERDAFHAESRAVVERVYRAMLEVGATVLDPPADYSGQPGYDDSYYAVFFADPDGVKLEVAYIPSANP